MTLNMDLGRDDSSEQAPLGADAQASGEKATPPPRPAAAAKAATAPPLSPRALMLRRCSSMVAGSLAGGGVGVFLFFNWMGDGGGGISFVIICAPLALVVAGFVTGLLLSVLCPRCDGRQPFQLFVCSPVIIYMFANCLLDFYRSGARAFSMPSSVIASLLPLTVIGMCVSWIGALAGWGVHSSFKRFFRPTSPKNNDTLINGER